MNTGRRISAAVLTAVITVGALGMTAGPAGAKTDTSWPEVVGTN